MVASELADLAGEANAAIGDEDLGLADASRVDNDLAGCREARVVLVVEAKIKIAERDPARLAAPAHMDDALAIGQEAGELRAGLRRRRAFEARGEAERAGGDANRLHGALSSAVGRSGAVKLAMKRKSPPALRTKIMPIGARPMIAIPSCPAPLGRRSGPMPSSAIARSIWSISAGVQGEEGASWVVSTARAGLR